MAIYIQKVQLQELLFKENMKYFKDNFIYEDANVKFVVYNKTNKQVLIKKKDSFIYYVLKDLIKFEFQIDDLLKHEILVPNDYLITK